MPKTTLKIAINNKDTGKTTFFKKEVDFVPSNGLLVYKPVYCTIGQSVVDENGDYLATASEVMQPTNPEEQIAYVKSIGFVEC